MNKHTTKPEHLGQLCCPRAFLSALKGKAPSAGVWWMSKRVFTALGKVFCAEIAGRMFQSKARIYIELELEGYVQFDSEVFGAGTRFPVTCSGWCLTHKGRMAYGEACEGASDEQ